MERSFARSPRSSTAACTSRKKGRRDPSAAATGRPARSMSAERPTAVMATVFPPPFGPETMSARCGRREPDVARDDLLPLQGEERVAQREELEPGSATGADLRGVGVEVGGEPRGRLEHVERRRAPRGPRASRAAAAPSASESSRRIRCSSSCATAFAIDSSFPSSTIESGSTKSVWPDCEALWTMPGTAERALARTGSTYRSLRIVK